MTCAVSTRNNKRNVATMPSAMSIAKRSRRFGSLHADISILWQRKSSRAQRADGRGSSWGSIFTCSDGSTGFAAQGWKPLSSVRPRLNNWCHFQRGSRSDGSYRLTLTWENELNSVGKKCQKGEKNVGRFTSSRGIQFRFAAAFTGTGMSLAAQQNHYFVRT